jgi:hypothetical protein
VSLQAKNNHSARVGRLPPPSGPVRRLKADEPNVQIVWDLPGRPEEWSVKAFLRARAARLTVHSDKTN